MLDIEYAAAISAGAEVWFWKEGPEAWMLDFAQHVFATEHVPLVFSISYGWGATWLDFFLELA